MKGPDEKVVDGEDMDLARQRRAASLREKVTAKPSPPLARYVVTLNVFLFLNILLITLSWVF